MCSVSIKVCVFVCWGTHQSLSYLISQSLTTPPSPTTPPTPPTPFRSDLWCEPAPVPSYILSPTPITPPNPNSSYINSFTSWPSPIILGHHHIPHRSLTPNPDLTQLSIYLTSPVSMKKTPSSPPIRLNSPTWLYSTLECTQSLECTYTLFDCPPPLPHTHIHIHTFNQFKTITRNRRPRTKVILFYSRINSISIWILI